jgi:hypothetical protein
MGARIPDLGRLPLVSPSSVQLQPVDLATG